jgi:predicted phage terminase large subunit-like protein
MSRNSEGFFFVEDVLRGQWSPFERDDVILQTAQLDGYGVEIMLEQEPGAAGKSVTAWLQRKLAGHVVRSDRPTGAKEVRAQPYAAQCEARNVKLVAGDWNAAYLDELCVFPYGAHDDQVDASSGAFMRLARVATEYEPPHYAQIPRPDPRRWGIQVEGGLGSAVWFGRPRR